MKVKYRLFFKSGIVKEYFLTETNEDIVAANEVISHAFENDMGGVLSLNDKEKEIILVRIADLSMVEIEEIE